MNFLFENKTEESDQKESSEKWLEEERKEETLSANSDDDAITLRGFSGGVSIALTPTTPLIIFHFIKVECNSLDWVILPKNPRYIEFCSLKLHC
ncbi:hypothetical protein [Maribacter antarcticus]|uniref:hypothetical protein n=1 Tax=Maribacter antarcticus TaxID=505250 RepID=UPI00047DF7C8|nr:hypothetical protein [Maribacter antarcticus]